MVDCASCLPELVETEAVELVAIRVDGGVLIDRVGCNFDVCACGDVLAVGECETFDDFTGE